MQELSYGPSLSWSPNKFTRSELWQCNLICAIFYQLKHICHKQDFLFPFISAVMNYSNRSFEIQGKTTAKTVSIWHFSLTQSSEMLIDLKLYFLSWAFCSCSFPTAAFSHYLLSNRWKELGVFTYCIFQFCPFFIAALMFTFQQTKHGSSVAFGFWPENLRWNFFLLLCLLVFLLPYPN